MQNERKATIVSDKTLLDSLGNSCRLEMEFIGEGKYELLLTDFNNSIPRRFIGGLSEMLTRGQLFWDAKFKDGFMEQLPSFNPHFFNQ